MTDVSVLTAVGSLGIFWLLTFRSLATTGGQQPFKLTKQNISSLHSSVGRKGSRFYSWSFARGWWRADDLDGTAEEKKVVEGLVGRVLIHSLR
jgi:hypothetical protein